MTADARAVLETFSSRELRSIAAEHGVDLHGCKGKADVVGRLARSENVQAALRTPPSQLRPMLAAQTVPALQQLAADLRVDVSGCEKKADYVGRIAASPAAVPLLEPPPPPPEPSVLRPDLAHATADPLVQQGRDQDVDFGLVEDVLDQARMRFEERNFDRTLELAREALLLGRGTLDGLERAAWAYALLAAQRLIEGSGRVGRDVEPAAAILRDAKTVYASGALAVSQDLLVKLQAATKALYSEEVRNLRSAIYATQEKVGQSAHVGGDVSGATEALARAREAMERAEHARAFELVAQAERLAAEALERRVQEIHARIPSAEKSIEEARHVGADVGEGARLLEKAKVALARREYVLAAELVQRAERAILEAQHHQIQKAMELRMRQIQKVQALVNYLVPIADEAAGFDLAIEESRRYLAEAHDVLDQGDYVNGTFLAKLAEDGLRRLVPRLVEERAKRGIAKPLAGGCETCGSADVAFLDDGWSKCNACGALWRWRAPSGLWEKFRSLLRE